MRLYITKRVGEEVDKYLMVKTTKFQENMKSKNYLLLKIKTKIIKKYGLSYFLMNIN